MDEPPAATPMPRACKHQAGSAAAGAAARRAASRLGVCERMPVSAGTDGDKPMIATGILSQVRFLHTL